MVSNIAIADFCTVIIYIEQESTSKPVFWHFLCFNKAQF